MAIMLFELGKMWRDMEMKDMSKGFARNGPTAELIKFTDQAYPLLKKVARRIGHNDNDRASLRLLDWQTIPLLPEEEEELSKIHREFFQPYYLPETPK